MPQMIEVPGFGQVEFPDDMDDNQIAKAIQANMIPLAEERPLSTEYAPPEKAGGVSSALKKMVPMSAVTDSDVLETAKNIPSSAYNLGKNIVTAVAHPVQTAKTIGEVGLGAIEKLTPGEGLYEDKANAVGQMFIERYGGLDNLRQTMTQDPVGFLADASTILSGVGTLPKMGVAAEIGRAIEPTGAIAKGVATIGKPVVGKAGQYTTEFLGKSTGAGAGSIEQALKGGKEFTEAMRGRVPEQELLDTAQNALQTVKNQRSMDYQSKLAEIGKQTQTLDIAPVKKSLDTFLNSWRIGRKQDGTLDFKRSVMAKDTKTQNEVLQMKELIDDWDDFSPVGVDVLKRNLDDFYTETGKGRAIAAGLRSETKKVLSDNVSGYADMTADYAKTSKLTKDIEKALSLSKGSGADTSIRKITQILRENFTYRRDLVKQLEDMTGKDIQSAVAGIQLQKMTPRGLQGTLATSGVGAMMYFVHPALALTLPIASPRAVGEFLNLLGNTSRQAKKIGVKAQKAGAGKAVSVPVRQTAFQSGRIQSEVGE